MRKRRDKKKSIAERRFDKHRELHRTIQECAGDILGSDTFQSTRQFIQHGSIPVHRHSIDVARQSLIISRFFHIPVNERELIRGALLHDYFLYDWHDRTREDYEPLHGFSHPGKALKNATRDFELSGVEKDIIEKHMWPLTVALPRYKESWIVTVADKYCSTLETLKIRKGAGVRRNIGIRGK